MVKVSVLCGVSRANRRWLGRGFAIAVPKPSERRRETQNACKTGVEWVSAWIGRFLRRTPVLAQNAPPGTV